MGKFSQPKQTKSGYLICVVPACHTKKSTTTLKTFEFPSDLKRRSQWISAIVDATLKIEEETSSLEDLYSLENKRMELEMEIAGILGDHSYVCARHFRPEDIIVHPQVCRLTANAVPSIFKNYPIDLPRQFFKKICQTVKTIHEESSHNSCDDLIKIEDREYNPIDVECGVLIPYEQTSSLSKCNKKEMITILSSTDEDSHQDEIEEVEEICESPSEEDYNEGSDLDSHVETKFSSFSHSKISKAKMRKRLRILEMRYRHTKKRLAELEKKHNLYNISSLEKDAENNNEEALFLLDMLRSYTVFEKTRKEILTSSVESN